MTVKCWEKIGYVSHPRHVHLVFKGIVHLKMKILSSFTHPQVVPSLYECLCSAEHKGRYSEECGKQSSSGAPLTSIVFFLSYYGSQWCPKTAWLQTFFKISSFVFGRTKTFIQGWNYLRVSKWWQNFHFWVNYPFKETALLLKWNLLQSVINVNQRTKEKEKLLDSSACWLTFVAWIKNNQYSLCIQFIVNVKIVLSSLIKSCYIFQSLLNVKHNITFQLYCNIKWL